MNNAQNILKTVEAANSIVITSHRSPDGDSIGSSLGMLRFLRKLGKSPVVCHPDPCPNFLEWLKHDDAIEDFETNAAGVTELLRGADLIFVLDYNSPGRLGEQMGQVLAESKGTKVMIDHHLNPDDFVDFSISQPEVCSTSQLVYDWFIDCGQENLIDAHISEPLYLGIVTDTGAFRFDSVTARTHEIVADMLRHGLRHTPVHENTFDGNRIDKLKLRGYAVAEKLEVIPEYKVAILSLTEEEMNRFHYIKGDTEGLVNVALSVEGVEVAVFFAQKEDKVKISFRSKATPVNTIASDHFEGGGHKYAAGGINTGTMEETLAKFKQLIPTYFG